MVQIVVSTIAISLALVWCVFVVWRGGRTFATYATVAAVFISAALEASDLLAIVFPAATFHWKRFALLAESVLPAAWFLFSLTHSRELGGRHAPFPQRLFLVGTLAFPAAVVVLPAESFFYSPDFAAERVLFLSNAGFWFYGGLLVYFVLALVNLEATYRGASLSSRWVIKFDFIGAVSFLSALVFYYSQALLYRTVNMNLMPVRSVMLILAVAMMFYSLIFRGGGARIAVSRSMAYKSVVLVAVGFYLIALGLLGEGLKYFGESGQRALAVALAFIAGVALLVLLLSETAKRKIKVFLHKNFYQSKYDYRTQWLQFTDRLTVAKSGDELREAVLVGYCEIFAMGCAALFVRGGEGGGFRWAAGVGLSRPEIFFTAHEPVLLPLEERSWVVDFRDEEPRFNDPDIDRRLTEDGIIFLVPLLNSGILEGIVALGRPIDPKEQYLYEDFDLMKTMGRQASSALRNLRLADELLQAKELEVMGKVSAFILHDLKNLVYTLSLTVENAQDHLRDPEFQSDMLATLSNTVGRMKVLISKLSNLPDRLSLKREAVDLLQLVSEARSLVASEGEIAVEGRQVSAWVDREEIQKVVLNLIVNALEATEGKGPVAVTVGEGSGPFFRVADRGCGIAEDFLHKDLFTPFRTTKKKGLGIGLYQCRQIVEAHGGWIEVESAVGEGTTFTVWLQSQLSS
ncbi:XrtA/PEP-CTERM system histidine kinase PrsK [Geobacter pickeringii]|uniref:histidine kinase n=1 Tax=Geobacter pickeringii TaxID=345632 RepID=A0A0B5BE87_9BACT|nr:XrtA/PEP-CTERM system histidine kinase PrsK [Geobacter pickeringii]AJE03464.1 histidine kinase [Geobacter pickeringii]